jgi:hypothetical protein
MKKQKLKKTFVRKKKFSEKHKYQGLNKLNTKLCDMNLLSRRDVGMNSNI